jgi:Holliday junction resolvase
MSKINSKQKGARFERELASKLSDYGFEARRTAQYCGNTGDASDVVGLFGIHIEAKHQERIQIYDWMAQAIHDSAKSGNKPAVFFRKNHSETLVCMRLSDWIELYREWAVSNLQFAEGDREQWEENLEKGN